MAMSDDVWWGTVDLREPVTSAVIVPSLLTDIDYMLRGEELVQSVTWR